jgi:hypothetical protein
MTTLNSEARRLVEATRTAGGPSRLQLDAMKRSVLAQVAGVPATARAGNPTAASTAKVGGAQVAAVGKLGVVLLAGLIGAIFAIRELRSPAATEARVEPAVLRVAGPEAPQALSPASVAPPVEPSALEPPPTAPAVPSRPAARREQPHPAVATARPPAKDLGALAREVAALEGAMKAVKAERYAGALAQLRSYRSAFPAGELSVEASVLEVLSLCGAGRIDEARTKGRELRVQAAGNPAIRRLEKSCLSEQGPARNAGAEATQHPGDNEP